MARKWRDLPAGVAMQLLSDAVDEIAMRLEDLDGQAFLTMDERAEQIDVPRTIKEASHRWNNPQQPRKKSNGN